MVWEGGRGKEGEEESVSSWTQNGTAKRFGKRKKFQAYLGEDESRGDTGKHEESKQLGR